MAERILMTNGKLKVTDNPIIPFIEGDGVGHDIWKNAQAFFDKAAESCFLKIAGSDLSAARFDSFDARSHSPIVSFKTPSTAAAMY